MSSAHSSSRAWLRALELTGPISRNRERILPSALEEVAAQRRDAPALLSESESFSYGELVGRAHRYARWGLAQGLEKGAVVCLLMPNRPEYMAIWLGLTSIGVVVALLNTNLAGRSLAHSIEAVAPACILVDARLAERLTAALAHLQQPRPLLLYGVDAGPAGIQGLSEYSDEALAPDEQRSVTTDDLALYIYTSGTTGLPKAARITHGRLMQWSHWFAGMMEVMPSDRMYNCLPMYHSVGGVQAPGALLVVGGSVVLRERFSASAFLPDVVRWQCTLFQYIGEMCRYLLHAPASHEPVEHTLRMACGNGLAPDVWEPFKERFCIPRIFEFYAATESNVSLFNVEGKSGAIGHTPSWLAHRFAPPLVRYDPETGMPARNAEGFCIRCGPNEAGEALGRIAAEPVNVGNRFDGYTSAQASEAKVLRHVFEPGDCWFRTGDLMRRDESGYYYFCDRVGDTFRRKGENVSTSEVAAALCAFAGVRHANVYGVAVPHVEGRVGMATLVTAGELDLAHLREHLADALPGYARPAFLRVSRQQNAEGENGPEMTGTWKYSKTELVRQGFHPGIITDPLYLDCVASRAFVPLSPALYEKIQSGEMRL